MKRQGLLIAGLCCLFSLPVQAESIRFLADAGQVPDDCEKVAEVSAEAGGPWWTTLMSDRHIKSKARKDLLKAALEAGGNTLSLATHRAFLRPKADELERVEETGIAWRCAGEDNDKD